LSTAEPWTIGRLLKWTTDHFREHGVDNPRLDAEVLLAHARGCERIDLYASFGDVAADDVRTRFRELVLKRTAGSPVAYLVGHREFYSLPFLVTQDVLIPRPETEQLVMSLLDLAKEMPGDPLQVVDVGTGSGNIAITIARHLPRAAVMAVDASANALDVARRNAERHGVADRLTFVEGDLLAGFPAEPRWNFIVSNPPYVSEAEYEALPREVKDHEPRCALVAGPRGTEVIERLIDQSGSRLKPGGWLLFELSPMIADACRELFTDDAAWASVDVLRDLSGHSRIVQARK
jgi:release factor glutamine methyltransferase